jgi:hypothetical protein
MIGLSQIEEFNRNGAVTIDAPFTAAELSSAADVFDRLLVQERPANGTKPPARVQRDGSLDQPLLELIQHPFLEETAKKTLEAAEVEFFAHAIVKSYPEPGVPFAFWEHVDIKYGTRDLDATPKRMICTCLVWLTDVTPDRAPLMFRLGSHRQIAAEVDKDNSYVDNPVPIQALPKLAYADAQPLLARRGQVTVCTTAGIHGASVNTGTKDRKVMFVNFIPRGYEIRANMSTNERRLAYLREMRLRLRPERSHIIPEPVAST